MKHLMVGYDFSPAADRALAYAEVIAQEMGAKISLVYILVPQQDRSPQADAPADEEAEDRLQELAADISSKGITTEAYVHKGQKGAVVLKRLVDEGDCELVVLGCQGAHAKAGSPLGSTTTQLIEDTRIPILAIPSYAPAKFPRRLLLATDEKCPRNLRQLGPLLDFLEADRTHLILFHYQLAPTLATPDRDYQKLLEGIDYRFFYQVDNQQRNEVAVAEFASLISADLLVVTHRGELPAEERVRPSVANSIVWESDRPLLILQESY